MISFTGSTRVGRHVGSIASGQLKRVSLELGGNNPYIVLDDVNIEAAASAGAWGAFFHQGQIARC
jgi:benzaldehyde dehydrogenase (NAD)